MSGRRTTDRDRKRRELGQNFLTDRSVVERFVGGLPRERYRVVANPPFGLTTASLVKLLDQPDRGPARADLIVQKEVARKLARQPPASLRAAAWAPWWEFSDGQVIDRSTFRPRPAVDAAVLTVIRREPPALPTWLGPQLRELLRPAWADRARW